jgi:hypothetical protein
MYQQADSDAGLILTVTSSVSTIRAKYMSLTTYYDPFYPSLHHETRYPPTLNDVWGARFIVRCSSERLTQLETAGLGGLGWR